MKGWVIAACGVRRLHHALVLLVSVGHERMRQKLLQGGADREEYLKFFYPNAKNRHGQARAKVPFCNISRFAGGLAVPFARSAFESCGAAAARAAAPQLYTVILCGGGVSHGGSSTAAPQKIQM